MKPELQSVKAIGADDTKTIVEIVYKTAAEMEGIELHGVEAGLSWLKGESKQLEKMNYTIYIANYKTTIEISTDCEFRARAFGNEEDYWEDNSHSIKRQSDASIVLQTDEKLLEKIKYTPKPPREYVPELFKVELIEVNAETSTCIISYLTSEKIDGIELHGVDGGLSWLKGQSILAEHDKEDGKDVLKISLDIESSIEFKARAFKEEKNFWEEGANHKIERLPDGTIAFIQSADDSNLVNVVNRLPIIYDLSLEDSLMVLKNETDIPVQFLQYLVCLKSWFDEYIKDPFNQDLFDMISGMTRSIREQSRNQKSQKIDELVLPIIKSLYRLYTEAISFMGEETQELIQGWNNDEVLIPFEKLIDNIKKMETDGFGDENDRKARQRTLSAYN